MSLFDISIINARALSTSKEVCISLGDIFHSFAPSTNEDEFKMLCLLLLMVGCIILIKYFEVPYSADPTVDTTALME